MKSKSKIKPAEPYKYPVLILGAGRGGTALLSMFLEDKLVHVVGIADASLNAPGISIAKSFGISTFRDNVEALKASNAYSECIIYNLTNDDSVAQQVAQVLGNERRVATGVEARLFWQMVTNTKQLKTDLERSQNHLQAIIHNITDGIITVSDVGKVCGFNPAAEQIFGCKQSEVVGESIKKLLLDGDQNKNNFCLQNYLDSHQEGNAAPPLEIEVVRKDGKRILIEMSLSNMVLNGQRYLTAIVRNITERKLTENKLAHLAHHDCLTDLPNRTLFFDRLEYSMSLAQRGSYQLAVLYLDLDGFKTVNDTFGHQVGDKLLKGVAARLLSIVRPSDTVARMGGDEFTFVLNNIANQRNAKAVTRKILHALTEPFAFDNLVCRVSGSIGISFFNGEKINPDLLLKQADTAMYQAKESGKNTYRVYGDPALVVATN